MIHLDQLTSSPLPLKLHPRYNPTPDTTPLQPHTLTTITTTSSPPHRSHKHPFNTLMIFTQCVVVSKTSAHHISNTLTTLPPPLDYYRNTLMTYTQYVAVSKTFSPYPSLYLHPTLLPLHLYPSTPLPLQKHIDDIHTICGCIKDFLRNLHEPIITLLLWQNFVDSASLYN